jgi:NAD(P)-dependent dehydrogenase (short-subunit alcohol dehydrogenase family)
MDGSHGARLAGRAAIISGVGSGIGWAAAQRFRAEGAVVVGIEHDADRATAAADALDLLPVVGSVADDATWTEAVTVAGDHGGVTVAYLNAGLYGYTGPIDELPLDLFRRTVGANIDGVVLGVRAVVPAMRAAGGGAVVATASVAGIVAFPPNPLYTLTKQAVTGFVQALAPNLAADGITVNAVCPGVVDTPMTVEATGGADPAALGFTVIDPATIAGVALDLATTSETGVCRAVLPHRDPIDWSFPDWAALSAATGGSAASPS